MPTEPPSPLELAAGMSADISDDGRYRYRLQRDVMTAGRLGVIAAWYMVNPSTADAENNDPTIKKVIGFSFRAGANKLVVCNKFAFRATDVRALRTARAPVGPENDAFIEATMEQAHIHIVAWGPLAKLPKHLRRRWRDVVGIADRVGVKLLCLGTAQDGHPRHPLMVSYDTPMIEWKRP